MIYEGITPLLSKRNHVFLAQDDSGRSVVVKDFGEESESFGRELQVSRILHQQGVAVPEVLDVSQNRIVYSFVEGTLAVDLLEQLEQPRYTAVVTETFGEICRWLEGCYNALKSAFGNEMILGDAHLRNFICGSRVYGVDFECAAPGRRETDIASLVLFTLTYTPMCTPAKYALAAFLCRRCTELMGLDSHLLRVEMSAQAELIATRRRIALPPEIIPELWELILHDTDAICL